jgi:hypothetical protein
MLGLYILVYVVDHKAAFSNFSASVHLTLWVVLNAVHRTGRSANIISL